MRAGRTTIAAAATIAVFAFAAPLARAAHSSAVWGTGITGAGVTVAVVDTGVTPNPELLHVLPGYNFVGNNTNTSDPNGHGTHIAGTIAQATDNAVGVAGVASGASILP